MSVLVDGVSLAVGTFTRVPVPPPQRVGPPQARVAMLVAPVIGVLVAAPGALVLLAAHRFDVDATVAAVAAVASLAWVTRGLHLDGLADLSDALGSGRRGVDALAVLRDPHVGAFAVVTVLLVLLAQVASLAALQTGGHAASAWIVAVVTGRCAVVAGCRQGVPAAAPTGLGAAVAGSVPAGAVATVLLAVLGLGWWLLGTAGVVAVLLAGVVVAWQLRVAVSRLGGVTGDVLGALVELATTSVLVVAAVLLPQG